MGLPPAEERSASLKAIGDSEDVFGNDTRPSQRVQLKQLEEQATDMLIVILSDVQLDKPHVLEKLQVVFEGFENNGECFCVVLRMVQLMRFGVFEHAIEVFLVL